MEADAASGERAHCVAERLDLIVRKDLFQNDFAELFAALHDLAVVLLDGELVVLVAREEHTVSVLDHANNFMG